MYKSNVRPTQTASTYDDETYRIYSDCLNLRTRLLSLPGFALYSELLLGQTDPVASIQQLFASGIPLCYLFNLLPPRRHPRIGLDFTHQNNEYTKRIAIAHFALRVHQAFGCPHFSIDDVLSVEPNDHFSKILNALTVLLDELSLAESRSPQSDQIFPKESRKRSTYLEVVRRLLESEHTFIMDMEVLESFSNALADIGVLDAKTVSLVFPKKLFTFARKFRVQLECVAQLPWQEQNWGAPFIAHTLDITMNLRIYCVNVILVKPALAELDMESLQIPGFKASSKSIETLLLVPLDHLSDYYKIFKELVHISASMGHHHHEDLTTGVACIQRIIQTVQKAQEKATSDQICDSLKTRIADWQGLELNSFGQLVLQSSLLTRRNDILQNFDVFLFENRLLLCDETLPPPTNNSRIGRRKLSSVSIPPSRSNMLYIKDHFQIRELSGVSTTEFQRLQVLRATFLDNGPRVFLELTLATGTYTLSLLYLKQQEMQEWYSKIQHLRQVEGQTELEISSSHQVQKSFSLPVPADNVPTHRRRAYSGTLTDLESGPVPQTFLQLTSTNPRSAFVKFQFGGHVFVLSVALPVQFDELTERIDKKLRYIPGWSREGRIITHTAADGHVLYIGPDTPLDSMFQEGTMVSLNIQ
ncbi:hypothetical protein GYMLUDRAFT_84770 [Collybiopsis luxurians FD-317 M1]|uniref:DH domain-containing protein n=1 Tax=Collybiopsis luxurians FD-317 M1 TaxID=944289 RepID=A0A0D0BD71_9AGAR|nr:hypothetical protein GYMLUDRAFT_84770 [Collybiopsis luxurians FD-317 M1]